MDALQTSIELLLTAQDKSSGAFDSMLGRLDGLKSRLDGIKDFAVGNILGSLGTDAITAAVGKLDQFGAGLISINAQTETLHQTLTALYQSSSSADQAFAYMTKFALAAPFTKQSIMQAGVAVASFGGDITQVLPALGNVAAVMGVDMPTAAQALTDAVEGRFQMMQRDLHVSKDELVQYGLELNSQGQVMNNTLLPAFEKFSQARFPQGMALQMTTFTGQLSNLEDQFQNFQRIMGGPIFEGVKSQMLGLISYLSANQTVVSNFAYTLGTVLGNGAQLAFQGLHTLLGGVEPMVNIFRNTWSALSGPATIAFNLIRTGLTDFGSWFSSTIAPAIGATISRIAGWWKVHGTDVTNTLVSLRDFLGQAFTRMEGYVGDFSNWVTGVAFPAIGHGLDALATFWRDHATGVGTVLSTIGANVASFKDYIARQMMNLGDMLGGTMTAGWGLVEVIVGGAVDLLSGNMTQLQKDWDQGSNNVVKGFIQAFTGLLGYVGSWGVEMVSLMAQAMVPVVNAAIPALTWLSQKFHDTLLLIGEDVVAGLGSVVDTFNNLGNAIDPNYASFLNYIVDKGTAAFTTLVSLAGNAAGSMEGAFATLPGKIGGYFSDILNKMGQLTGLMSKIPFFGGHLPSLDSIKALITGWTNPKTNTADAWATGDAIGRAASQTFANNMTAQAFGGKAPGPGQPGFIGPVIPQIKAPGPGDPGFIGPVAPKALTPGQQFEQKWDAWLDSALPGLKGGQKYQADKSIPQAQADIRAQAAAIIAPYMLGLQQQEAALLKEYVKPNIGENAGGTEAGGAPRKGADNYSTSAGGIDWAGLWKAITSGPSLVLKIAPEAPGGKGPQGDLKVPGMGGTTDPKAALAAANAAVTTAQQQFANDLKYQSSMSTLMADVKAVAVAQLAAHVSAVKVATTTKDNLDKVAGEVRSLAVQDKTDGQSQAVLLADIRNYQSVLVAAGDKPSQVKAAVDKLTALLGQSPQQLAKVALTDAKATLKVDIQDGSTYKQLLTDAGVAIRDLKASGEKGAVLQAETVSIYQQVLTAARAQFTQDVTNGADQKVLSTDVADVMNTMHLMGKSTSEIEAAVKPLNAAIVKLGAGASYTGAQQQFKIDLGGDASIQTLLGDVHLLATLDAARGSKPDLVKLDSSTDWSSLIQNLRTRLTTSEAGGASSTELIKEIKTINDTLLQSGATAEQMSASMSGDFQTAIGSETSKLTEDVAQGKTHAQLLHDIAEILRLEQADGYSKTAIAQDQTKLLASIDTSTKTTANKATAPAAAGAAPAAAGISPTDWQSILQDDQTLISIATAQHASSATLAALFAKSQADQQSYNATLHLDAIQAKTASDDMASKSATFQAGQASAAASQASTDAKATDQAMQDAITLDNLQKNTGQAATDTAKLVAWLQAGGGASEGLTATATAIKVLQLQQGATSGPLSSAPVALLRAQSTFGDALTGAGSFMQSVASLSFSSGGNQGINAVIQRLEQQNRQLELEVSLLSQSAQQGLTLIQGVKAVNNTLQTMNGGASAPPPAGPTNPRISSTRP